MLTTSLRNVLLLAALLSPPLPALAEPIAVHPVKPSVADPAVKAFDDVSLALSPRSAGPATPLVVFLPGTGGKPEYRRAFLEFIAQQYYRVVGLAYDDEPSLSNVCPRNCW